MSFCTLSTYGLTRILVDVLLSLVSLADCEMEGDEWNSTSIDSKTKGWELCTSKGFYWCYILILLWCDQWNFVCFLRICVWILLSWAALVSLSKSPIQRMKIKIKIELECELVIDGWVVLWILMDYLMPHALEFYFLLFVC